MAQPPPSVQLTPESYDQKDRPAISRLAGSLNTWLLAVNTAFSRALTFSENFAGDTRTIRYTAGQPLTFKYNGSGRPTIMILGGYRNVTNESEVIAAAVGHPQWSWDGRGNITITTIPGLTATNQYDLTLSIQPG
jgi:uncharacterized protein RhaS with RHS repeats